MRRMKQIWITYLFFLICIFVDIVEIFVFHLCSDIEEVRNEIPDKPKKDRT